jgi:nicotinate-nucleotide adenylyltransferase
VAPPAGADVVLTSPLLDVSSTEIRRRIAAGAPVRHLVPEPVLELIRAEGLYAETP